MTIKSIETILSELISTGRLVQYVPIALDDDEAMKRTLLMVPEIHDVLFAIHPSKDEASHYAAVRAQFSEFVKGEVIVDDEKTIKRISRPSEALWQFRITFKPGERFGGGFALQDTFVIVSGKPRKRLHFESWKGEIMNSWKALFPEHERFPRWPLAACICNVREP